MREILSHLPAEAVVLDLGSSGGSFDADSYPFSTVRVDLRAIQGDRFVQADAARLPFRSYSFDAVICNHGLEHLVELESSLREIGRVVKPNGALFVAIPDSSTLTDKLYRWAYNGGGHVNPFREPNELAVVLTRLSGLPHIATRILHSSFSYLNRRNFQGGVPRRAALLSVGGEASLAILSSVARTCDRRFGTRMSVYGWAMYFGRVDEEIDLTASENVCIRCGQGHSRDCLESLQIVRSRQGIRYYRCPACQAFNLM